MMPLRSRQGTDQRSSGLTAAERARTIIASASSLQVGALNMTSVVNRHAVVPDGSVLFMPGPDSPERVFAVARNLPPQTVQVTAIDVGGIAHADRIRGTLAYSGKLGLMDAPLPVGARAHLAGDATDDGGPVLWFVPHHVRLTWHCEVPEEGPAAVDIALEDYERAFPDPLLPHEVEWLTHLHRHHHDSLRDLARLHLPDLGRSAVRPLCLDRFGIVLRVYDDGDRNDVRLDFASPLRCGCELDEAFLDLLDRAGTGGLTQD